MRSNVALVSDNCELSSCCCATSTSRFVPRPLEKPWRASRLASWAERTWRLLTEAGLRFGVPPGFPRWRHTYHALPRLVLDYILLRDRTGTVRRARIERLDQDPADRGPMVFGSDHHPLLARIDFNPE